MIQRIFHPIGQGAFYSERHEKYNIVYDCGNWKNTSLADKVVKQAFSNNDEIEVLFISHFDFDHVSKVSTLKNHVKLIKNVVLPLLHQEEKDILLPLYRILNPQILPLIDDPKEYFGSKTNLIFVSPSNDNDMKNENILPKNINELEPNNRNIIEILSGQAISLGNDDWVFIPYNHEYKSRSRQLIKEIENAGFDYNKLISDPTYTLNQTIREKRKLKAAYNKLSGDINQNSMILYSGPLKNQNYRKYCLHKNYSGWNYFPNCSFDKVGCVYTGDSDLNIVKIKSVFKDLWNRVGTIQIPHHGDIKSFDKQVISSGNYCCPISLSTNNSYGHPSMSVIADIIQNRCCPILVTEKLNSFHIEMIEKQH